MNTRFAVPVLLLLATLSLHAQKESVPTLRTAPSSLVTEYDAASAVTQPAVRLWISEQAALLRSAASFTTATTSLRDAIRKRFGLRSADSATAQAVAMLAFTESMRDASQEHARLLARLSVLNAAAATMSDVLAALADASRDLAAAESTCSTPLCMKYNHRYGKLLTFKSVAAVAALSTTAVRSEREVVARKQELLAAAEKVRLEHDTIEEQRKEAARRYEFAMSAAVAALGAARIGAAASVASTSSDDTDADSTLPAISRLVVRLK